MAITRLPYDRFVGHDIRGEYYTQPTFSGCPMCRSELIRTVDDSGTVSDYSEEFRRSCMIGFVSDRTIHRCEACGWVTLREAVEEGESAAGTDILLTATLGRFDDIDADPILQKLRAHAGSSDRNLLRMPPEELGDFLELALRASDVADRVSYVACDATALEVRRDVYLVGRGSHAYRMFQVSRREQDGTSAIKGVWLLNGVVYSDGSPSHALITTTDKPRRDRAQRLTHPRPPHLVHLTDPAALLEAVAGDPSDPLDVLLERARHTSSTWTPWVPVPSSFFPDDADRRCPNPSDGPPIL